MRLLLARHGQSLWNEVRKFQGTTDVALSMLGRRQAEALGRAVRGRRLAAAYVSPMQRALDTATIALEGTDVPIVPVDELRELSLGECVRDRNPQPLGGVGEERRSLPPIPIDMLGGTS